MKFSIKDFFSKYDQIHRKLEDLVTFTEEIFNIKLHEFREFILDRYLIYSLFLTSKICLKSLRILIYLFKTKYFSSHQKVFIKKVYILPDLGQKT